MHLNSSNLNSHKGLHAAEPTALGSGTKRKRNADKAKGWWKQPWQIDSLLLDTEALLIALETGRRAYPLPEFNCSPGFAPYQCLGSGICACDFGYGSDVSARVCCTFTNHLLQAPRFSYTSGTDSRSNCQHGHHKPLHCTILKKSREPLASQSPRQA